MTRTAAPCSVVTTAEVNRHCPVQREMQGGGLRGRSCRGRGLGPVLVSWGEQGAGHRCRGHLVQGSEGQEEGDRWGRGLWDLRAPWLPCRGAELRLRSGGGTPGVAGGADGPYVAWVRVTTLGTASGQ